METTIHELKAQWNKEKDFYRYQEAGTGVAKFVKDVLKSKYIFNLKEGLKSTPKERRKNEFLQQEKTKELRRADIIIFISPEIIIPVEVEKYENIEAGEEQILQYQTDLDKKYGILTDGYTWRFYNNNLYREFTLADIFDNLSLFLAFWQEYIKPEYYYLQFFDPKGQLKFSFGKEKGLPVEENKSLFFDDITTLIKSFKNKLELEKYINNSNKKEREKRAVEITYAYIIQFILYKTLVDNEFGDFPREYNSISKNIYKFLQKKQYKYILGIIEGISNQISKDIYKPFKEEQKFITDKLLEIYRGGENRLSDVSLWLDIFVFIKKYNFAQIHNEIFGYIYENYLKELYEEENKGQYFTDPAVVNFMIEQIGYTPENLKEKIEKDKDSISLCDPACGSGTFLYTATNSIIKIFEPNIFDSAKQIEELVTNNIFGLDIAEFPLYLAEMNILMRMLPLIISEKYNNPVEKKIKVFKTRDSVAEFLDTAIRNTISDIQMNEGQLNMFTQRLDLGYKSFVRDPTDLEEMKKSLENQPRCPRYRFDYVIGNPPYISYNECCKQGILIFELIKEGKVKLNNIYGVNLHSTPMHHKKYPPKPNIYAFFIAVGLALLKDNGKLCYIIPQTVLINPDLDVIRYHLAKFTTIEKIILFSTRMFVGRGLRGKESVPTSSLIFVATRRVPDRNHQVEIITYIDPNDDIETVFKNISAGKKIIKKKIPQNKLLQNVANWNFIKQTKEFLEFYEIYQRNTEDMMIYYNHTMAEKNFGSKFYFDEGYDINERNISNIPPEGKYYLYPWLNENFWTIRENKGFWPNIRKGKSPFLIKLLKTNQEYNLLDSKYKLIWSYNNTTNFFFTDLPIIWARNKYLGVGSNNKSEILYLFALLNSPMTKFLLSDLVKVKYEETRTILVSLQIIKNQIRIPRIGKHNQYIKDEIIKRTEEMLLLEEKTLSDFVDFSAVMIQKFDKIYVDKDNLILIREDRKLDFEIKGDANLIKKVIETTFASNKIEFQSKEITLNELKTLPVIDFDKQNELKNYIDDLVFALYFNVKLPKEISFDKAGEIKSICQENKFYRIIKKE